MASSVFLGSFPPFTYNGSALVLNSVLSVSASSVTSSVSIVAPSLLVNAATSSGIGYIAGAGGAATQLTNKGTSVQIDKFTGNITMDAAALNAATSVSFTLTNATIAATDMVLVQHISA